MLFLDWHAFFAEVERFLVAIANKLPGSLDRDRGSLLHKVLELRSKHQECLPSGKQKDFIARSPDTPPALPDRRSSNASLSSRTSITSPLVPPRPASSISSDDGLQETYEAVDADPGFDKKACTLPGRSKSRDQPTCLQTRHERKQPPVPPPVSHPNDDVYEPPAPAVSLGLESNELYMEAETHLDQDQNYHLMEHTNSQTGTMDGGGLLSDDVYTAMDVELPSADMPPASPMNLPDQTQRSNASSTPTKGRRSSKVAVTMDSITDPDCTGTLKRKKDKALGSKWQEQTVIVKDNMIFIGGKDLSGDVAEFFSLSDAIIESVKIARQQHAFQIKPKLGKNVCFAAENAVEMQEWVRVLNRAASKSVVSKRSTQEPQCDQADPAGKTTQTDDLIMDDVYEMPEIEQLPQLNTAGPRNEGKCYCISYNSTSNYLYGVTS